jgi:hypothetical protein
MLKSSKLAGVGSRLTQGNPQFLEGGVEQWATLLSMIIRDLFGSSLKLT